MSSTKKVRKESKRGGARPGAGRPEGQTKVKISVSVDSKLLEAALKIWGGKTSQLVECLIKEYAEVRKKKSNGVALQTNN